MTDDSPLYLKLPAEPENVGRMRDAVATRARSLGLGRTRVDDLKTAVSEACANVVLHAYPESTQDRPMEVEMTRPRRGMLRVLVRDHGTGIGSGLGDRSRSLHLGLALVGSLADCFQLRTVRGRGTELLFELPLAEPT